MEKILVVIDMQNDFIDGSLGTKEAQTIVPNVIKKIKEYKPQNISQSSHIRISPDAIPDTASYPLFCEQFAASIASTSNNAGISLLGLSYSMTYMSPQLRSFLCTWTTALQASYTS